MLELQLEIQLEGQINLEMEIQNTEIVIKEGFDQFDINLINPTLSAGELVVPFSFNPSPQEDVTSVELWVNGSMIESRLGNTEDPFTSSGIVGAATVQIRAYNNGNLMQQSAVYQLPIPNAADFDDFSFNGSKLIDVIAECSDPQGLPIEIKYLGVPTNGLVSLIDTNFINVQEVDRNNPTLIPYVIENSVGATDSGEITFHWEEISITIDTPTENQEIPSDEDVTVAFTVTPATQNYISAIALVVDGVEVEKRTPYSGDDFTIDAGTLSEAAHTLRLRAYDLDDVQVFETGVRNFEVTASQQFLLDIYPNQFGESFAFHRVRASFTGDLLEIKRDDGTAQRFALDSSELPIAAISSFVGSGNGKATWWKGQANELEVSQTSDGACPLLFENGVLITENGQPALKFSGAQELLFNNFVDFSKNISSFIVCSVNVDDVIVISLGDGSKLLSAGTSSTQNTIGVRSVVGESRTTNYTLSDQVLINSFSDENQIIEAYLNNFEMLGSETIRGGTIFNSIGSRLGLFYLDGTIQEIHIYNSNELSDRLSINNLINQRYNIY